LIENSWILISKDPFMRLKYMKLKSFKGAKRAIVTFTRKLIIRIGSILLHNTPYMIGNQEAYGNKLR
jgi:hypothetical protein